MRHKIEATFTKTYTITIEAPTVEDAEKLVEYLAEKVTHGTNIWEATELPGYFGMISELPDYWVKPVDDQGEN